MKNSSRASRIDRLNIAIKSGTNLEIASTAAMELWEIYGDGQAFYLAQDMRHRVIIYVVAVHEILMDTGSGAKDFDSIVNENFCDDDRLSKMRQAYLELNCQWVAQLFEKLLSHFPNSRLPESKGERYRAYCRIPESNRIELGNSYRQRGQDVERALATFVRKNIDCIVDSGKIKSRNLNSIQVISPEKELMESIWPQIEELPHWGRIAVAARFALIAFSRFDEIWPNALQHRRDSLVNCTDLATKSACFGKPLPGVMSASTDAIATAGVAQMVLHGLDSLISEPAPEGDLPARQISNIARAAFKAVEATRTESVDSESDCFESINCSIAVTFDNKKLIDRMLSDLEIIVVRSRKEKWSSKTKVPIEIFSA